METFPFSDLRAIRSPMLPFGYCMVVLTAVLGLALLPVRGEFRVMDLQLFHGRGDGCAPVVNPPVLRLQADGTLSFRGRSVPKSGLASAVSDYFYWRADKVIALSAAPNRTFQDLIDVAGIARGAGALVIAWADRPTPWCPLPID